MNKTFFIISIYLTELIFGYNNQAGNNSQQPQFESGNRRGFGGPGNFSPKEMAQRLVERLSEKLIFSEKQAVTILYSCYSKFKKMQEMRGQVGDSRNSDAMREQMQKSREKQDDRIKSVLTDEQWEEYQAYQEEMTSKRGQLRLEVW